jgi:hypothetical protein
VEVVAATLEDAPGREEILEDDFCGWKHNVLLGFECVERGCPVACVPLEYAGTEIEGAPSGAELDFLNRQGIRFLFDEFLFTHMTGLHASAFLLHPRARTRLDALWPAEDLRAPHAGIALFCFSKKPGQLVNGVWTIRLTKCDLNSELESCQVSKKRHRLLE